MKKLICFASAFSALLSLSCVTAANVPEECKNGEDDNKDGATDCSDEQCVGTPECTEVCNNGLDEDEDGQTDCDDSDCDPALNCQLSSSEICNNGTDDDGDAKIDCQDENCFSAANCVQSFVEVCDNNKDDDNDGLVDCQDSNCSSNPECAQPELCQGGGDEDLDGQVDCQDSDCFNNASCTAAPTCGDGNQDAGEDCDGNDLGGASCVGEGFAGGSISCNGNCTLNTSACTAPACNPANDTCAGNDICIVDDCEPAFGRAYLFSDFFVSLDSTDVNGEDWDFGSDPDIRLDVILNDVQRLRTQEITNGLTNGRYNASFNETVTLTINSGDKIEFLVVDVDVNANDVAISCVANPLSAAILRFRDIECITSDGVTAILNLSITPQ